jgi:hypothetical protein
MIHNHWLRITHSDSQPLTQHKTTWLMSQWLWIMLFYAESVVVNHYVLFWASGCESWCAMLSQWLWVILSYAKPVIVTHHDSHSLPQQTTCSALHTMIHNHWFSITHHNSQPLAQYITLWLTTTYEPVVVNYDVLCWTSGCESWCAMLTKWFWIMVCNAEHSP